MRSKLNYVFLCFLNLIFFSSCKKSGLVSGSVVNIFNGQPVPNMTVVLNQTKEKLMPFASPQERILERTLTDSKGEFVMEYKYKSADKFSYSVRADDAIFTAEIDTVPEIKETYILGYGMFSNIQPGRGINRTGENVELSVVSAARVKIISNNVNPWNENDMISVYAYGPSGDSIAIYSAYGMGSKTQDYQYIPAYGSIPVKWFVIRNSYTTVISESINVQVFGKAIYYINW